MLAALGVVANGYYEAALWPDDGRAFQSSDSDLLRYPLYWLPTAAARVCAGDRHGQVPADRRSEAKQRLGEKDAKAVVASASPRASGSGFLSFRYSSTIVSSHGGRTQVKAKRVSLEDGKLSTESFEGELDGRAHEDAVRRAQQEVLEEAAPLLRMLRWMLPMR
jgi:hypothetical protein